MSCFSLCRYIVHRPRLHMYSGGRAPSSMLHTPGDSYPTLNKGLHLQDGEQRGTMFNYTAQKYKASNIPVDIQRSRIKAG